MAGSLFGKKFPVPLMRTYGPFYAAGAIVFYGVWKLQTALSNTDEYKNDPRNPMAKRLPAAH